MTTTSPSPDPAAPARRARPGFGLLGPRRGRHELPPEQFETLALPVGDDGVVIGADEQGVAAVLGLGRPTPFDVVLVGGAWTAQVIALRTVGTGARVAVETGRRQLWTGLAQSANGGQQCVTLHDVGRVPPQGPSVHSPVLVVRDCGVRPPRGRVASSPWQSVLTLLPYLSPIAPRLMGHADLVGVQRVSPDEARQIGRLMRLSATDVEALSTLPDGVTLWCTRTSRMYVATQPTEPETGLLGAARRMD
ncbi:hypothetical protein BLA24_22990 [Streptomyces cinnamoneus]|uniref:Uncharacterized protein n=1 Tax=Streptomyces cinnamoneus TaxID=53446 RepID=A0A2G1XCI8_STRCJ|nr:hypothetical protein [Streptomyces cinnamoneus]PHQ48974.1 hypothetical protein BLA24_22990 [Streptomyces cinnamoneus]PPT15381.1 hypothetical protein CYQ11_23085 [Streptomyces cinnamoneus]